MATKSDGVTQGMVVMDLDTLDEFNTTFMEKYSRECPAGSLQVVEQEMYGWELERKYRCGFCKKHTQ